MPKEEPDAASAIEPDENSNALSAQARTGVKKKFVEPEVSAPVDVLEATTFFQSLVTGPN